MHFKSFDIVPFPDPNKAGKDGLVAIGGELSSQMILSAYVQGLFPWFNQDEPIMWWSPDPRMILFPQNFKTSQSLKQTLQNSKYNITYDKHFEEVITLCARIKRKDQEGTWITDEMINAYCKLNKEGYAHSVEVIISGKLAGGLYGLAIGGVFFGESMFHTVRDSSKIALYFLCRKLIEHNYHFIDVQQSTSHLKSLGAHDISRKRFTDMLSESIRCVESPGKW